MKYVLDTCIFKKMLDGKIRPESLPKDGEFIASHIQEDELNKTKDEQRRARLLPVFVDKIKNVVPTETTVIEISRIGRSKLSDGSLYRKIIRELDVLNKSKKNNAEDALIAEIAITNGYTLLTTDNHLQQVAKNNGCNVIYWNT